MMNRPFLAIAGLLFIAMMSGCNTVLKNHSVSSREELLRAKRGIPWVETRQYDVYVFRGKTAPGPCADADGNVISCQPTPVPIYYGRHDLLDQVSGVEIDPKRRRWETNYEARTFSDGTLLLEFDELGVLKKAELTGSAGLGDAAKTANTAAGIPEAIQKKDDAEQEAELKRLETKKKIRDARKALEQ